MDYPIPAAALQRTKFGSVRAAGLPSADIAAETVFAAETPMFPQFAPRDEAVMLLSAAAEVEHALMVQYLFAAYSIRVDAGPPNLKEIQERLIQIAREEMGHFATVQNLLHLLGGPLNFRREGSPFSSQLYPFRFKLQPLTLGSLAKYVIAESPAVPPDGLTQEELSLLAAIEEQAETDNDGYPIQHVGPIFARLLFLFSDEAEGLADEDFRSDNIDLRARYEDWGYDAENEKPPGGERIIVDPIDANTPSEMRSLAISALTGISEQGEGFDPGPANEESHFERFFDIYKMLNSSTSGGSIAVSWPLPVNSNTTAPPPQKPAMGRMVDMVIESHKAQGRITSPRALAWAKLFNLRYRLLLDYLSHYLRIGGTRFSVGEADNDGDGTEGDRTPRGLLMMWTFNEMRRLRKIALKLVQIPKDENENNLNAGPPFELPYTLSLPEQEAARWRTHLDVSIAAARQIEKLLAGVDADDGFLIDLKELDQSDQSILRTLAIGQPIPEAALPREFQKVVAILEEAVRGFSISSHGNFWDRKNRDEFIEDGPFGQPAIHRDPDGDFDTEKSALVHRAEGTVGNRMPRYRPPIPPSRIQFIRSWIDGGCKHDGQVGITRERNPQPEQVPPVTPPDSSPLSFATDIKPLFRETPDRTAMLIFGLDLHKFDDVSNRADDILARLSDGTMPCDAAWPPERINKFERWINEGKLP